MTKILVLNGSNLNMLGVREPDFYGTETLDGIRAKVEARAAELGVEVDFRHSNFEGDIINWIHEAHTGADGIILNPGGFTRTSLSILDAIKAISRPVIELHMANPHKREAYRGSSFVSYGAHGIIAGFRGHGYVLALEALVQVLAAGSAGQQSVAAEASAAEKPAVKSAAKRPAAKKPAAKKRAAKRG